MNIEQIVKESKKIAINALKHFIKSLDLNEDAFNHIYNTPITIRNIGPVRVADYDHFNNIINVNKKDLEENITMIKIGMIKETTVELNIANAIVHEMIHANRTIQMNDSKNDNQINIVSEFYHKNDNKSEEYKRKTTKIQTIFEEQVTEALAQMIILNRKKEQIDLEKANQIIQENEDDAGIKIAAQILTNIGLDNIKWFMTSVYDEVYNDKFSKIFEEEYENLLMDAEILENPKKSNEFMLNYSIKDAYRIIEEKTGKKR